MNKLPSSFCMCVLVLFVKSANRFHLSDSQHPQCSRFSGMCLNNPECPANCINVSVLCLPRCLCSGFSQNTCLPHGTQVCCSTHADFCVRPYCCIFQSCPLAQTPILILIPLCTSVFCTQSVSRLLSCLRLRQLCVRCLSFKDNCCVLLCIFQQVSGHLVWTVTGSVIDEMNQQLVAVMFFPTQCCISCSFMTTQLLYVFMIVIKQLSIGS